MDKSITKSDGNECPKAVNAPAVRLSGGLARHSAPGMGPAESANPSDAVPSAASEPQRTTPVGTELPTFGEWVRSLLAEGFVPVKIQVMETPKARAPGESGSPSSWTSPEQPADKPEAPPKAE